MRYPRLASFLAIATSLSSLASGGPPRIASDQSPLDERELDRAIRECALPGSPRTERALGNGGFEVGAEGASPDGWIELRRGFRERDASLARTGEYSVRSSLLFGYTLVMEPPASPLQNVALVGYALPEFTGETASTTFIQSDASGQSLGSPGSSSPLSGGGGVYSEFWTPQFLAEGCVQVQMLLGGGAVNMWPRFDDLRMYREQFSDGTPDEGEPWSVADGASLVEGGVLLPPGGSASQRVVTGRRGEHYFVAATSSAEGASEIEVREEWLRRSDADDDGALAVASPVAAGVSRVTTLVGRPAGVAPSGLLVCRLVNTGSEAVELTHLARGFIRVEPEDWKVGASSPDTPLRVTFALEDQLSSAAVEILDESDTVVASPAATLQGETAIFRWDGATAQSGAHRARVTATDRDGNTIVVERPFSITREPDSPVWPPVAHGDEFARCAWVWYIASEDNGDILRGIQAAKADGYEMGVLHLRTDQLADAAQIIADEQFPVYVFVPEVNRIARDYLLTDVFSEARYLDDLRGVLAPMVGSPWLRGVYVFDEPSSAEDAVLVGRLHRALSHAPDLGGASLSTLSIAITPAQLEQIQSPAFLNEIYPFFGSNTLPDGGTLLAALPAVNTMMRAGEALGRPGWFVPQGFEEPGAFDPYRAVPPATHRAMLHAGLLVGAKGTMTFTHSSITSIEGLRGPDNEPTDKLAEYVRFNALVERLEPLLLSIPAGTMDPRAASPFAASTATSRGGSNFAFILNADDSTTRTMTVDLAPAPAAPIRDHVGEWDLAATDGRIEVPLGPGELALLQLDGSSVADFIEDDPPPPPRFGDVTLPVTHSFVALTITAQRPPITQLSFSPDGSTIAVSHAWWFMPGLPMAWSLGADGNATQLPGEVRFPGQLWRYVATGELYGAAEFLGFELFDAGNTMTGPVAAFVGQSGGTLALAQGAGPDWWAAQFQFGIARLERDGANFTRVGQGIAQIDVYDDAIAPFDGGNALAMIRNTGVSRVVPGAESEDEQTSLPLSRIQGRMEMNARRQVAVPRRQRGVAIVQVDASGKPTGETTIAEDALEVTSAAWLRDDILAVADARRGVRFYRVDEAAAATLLATWRPEYDTEFFITAVACSGNRLAVGLLDGRVLIANAGSIRTLGLDQSGWMVR